MNLSCIQQQISLIKPNSRIRIILCPELRKLLYIILQLFRPMQILRTHAIDRIICAWIFNARLDITRKSHLLSFNVKNSDKIRSLLNLFCGSYLITISSSIICQQNTYWIWIQGTKAQQNSENVCKQLTFTCNANQILRTQRNSFSIQRDVRFDSKPIKRGGLHATIEFRLIPLTVMDTKASVVKPTLFYNVLHSCADCDAIFYSIRFLGRCV